MLLSPLYAAGPVVVAHAFCAFVALLVGIWQLAARKGGKRHRVVGYIWSSLMMGVAVSSLWIPGPGFLSEFSPIHILTAVTLITLPLGIIRIRRGDVRGHAINMISLFVGALVVAGAFTLLPGRAMHAVVFGSAMHQ